MLRTLGLSFRQGNPVARTQVGAKTPTGPERQFRHLHDPMSRFQGKVGVEEFTMIPRHQPKLAFTDRWYNAAYRVDERARVLNAHGYQAHADALKAWTSIIKSYRYGDTNIESPLWNVQKFGELARDEKFRKAMRTYVRLENESRRRVNAAPHFEI